MNCRRSYENPSPSFRETLKPMLTQKVIAITTFPPSSHRPHHRHRRHHQYCQRYIFLESVSQLCRSMYFLCRAGFKVSFHCLHYILVLFAYVRHIGISTLLLLQGTHLLTHGAALTDLLKTEAFFGYQPVTVGGDSTIILRYFIGTYALS